MRRGSIKRGTYFILMMATLCTIVIFGSAYMRSCIADRQSDKIAKSEIQAVWSDSLTNLRSDYAPLHRMDAEIERFMGKWGIKGLSLAITRNDSLLYAKGYGWADMEEQVEMQPTNIMRIASASKLVTAIAIMRLCEDKQLTLGSKVFGPDGILNDTLYTNVIRDRRLFDITVDHLLRHQAGFGMGAGDPMFNTSDIIEAKNLSAPPSNEELVAIVLPRQIAFTPGQGFRYSNFGYMLLSLVIERVTGKDYWDYVTENVLLPAGCHKFRPATNYYHERHPDEVRYYGSDTVKVKEFNGSGKMVDLVYGGRNVNGLVGAGGWCTTASDLARLVAATDKYARVPNILSDASIDSLTAYSRPEESRRSRGWSEISENGKWRRTGTLSSSHALVEHFPDGECWVLITNSGVWIGPRFSSSMSQLVSRLKSAYDGVMPRRDLFEDPK